jgi:hypothetical protein
MSGALVDLVAKGVQDSFITGNPEVSFFRQMYKRHTNFAQKPILLNPMGSIAANSQISIKIPQKGDLLSYMWVDLGSGSVSSSGIDASHATKPAVFELFIGGQLIDRQDSTYMIQVWNKFMADSGAKTKAIFSTGTGGDDLFKNDLMTSNWVPLHFFFCDNTYLPLVAIQYHEVEIRVTFGNSSPPSDIKFFANYIMLDADERTQVTEHPHEILIEQVQKIYADNTSTPTSSPRFDLNLLNHPVKALFWVRPDNTNFNADDIQLYLNGSEVFEEAMPDKYFRTIQGYYHSEHGSELLRGSTHEEGGNIKMYSFALKVNKHQPCGTCNFSRLDNADLHLKTCTGVPETLPLYAVNYNILRIREGVAGLAFAN